jgi:hypothetical protein
LPTEARGVRGKQLLFLSNTFCFKDEGAKGNLYACLNIPFQAERGDDEHENEQQPFDVVDRRKYRKHAPLFFFTAYSSRLLLLIGP